LKRCARKAPPSCEEEPEKATREQEKSGSVRVRAKDMRLYMMLSDRITRDAATFGRSHASSRFAPSRNIKGLL
jgi:hypothetical protein